MQLHRLLFLFLFLSAPASAQSIIITEIFADPTPSRGLPEVEFLEIYNTSPENIRLKGYTLRYGNTTISFPDSVIAPGTYAIVCRNIHLPLMQSLGHAIGIPNLSLNNNGATLRLLNPEQEEIHYVSYSSEWYTEGRNDGYSLEMIDKNYPCRGRENWASTRSESGATPGAVNSVNRENADALPPVLLESSFQKDHIVLFFNEVLSPGFALNVSSFEVLKGQADIVKAGFLDDSRQNIILTLDSEEEDMEIMIYEAEDCSGNRASDIRLSFREYPNPSQGDIQISEVLFNPRTGGEDFVEVHNTSARSFNLKGWQLAHRNSQGNMAGYRPLAGFDRILEPAMYLAFTTNRDFLEDNYPRAGHIAEIPSLPAYNNDQGTVYLLRPDSSVYDQFTYNEKMHMPLLHNPDGVSLEKVSFRPNQNRWTSASSDAGFATPGSANSQQENDFLLKEFVADPVVFNPFQTSDKSETFLTYRLSKEANYASVSVLDKNGRKVRSLGQNMLLGTSGKIAWNGTDDHGSLLPAGYYVFFIHVFGNDTDEQFYAKTVIGSY